MNDFTDCPLKDQLHGLREGSFQASIVGAMAADPHTANRIVAALATFFIAVAFLSALVSTALGFYAIFSSMLVLTNRSLFTARSHSNA